MARANKDTFLSGFMMPNEQGIDEGILKKQFLFFDSVKVVDISDRSLVHSGEVVDKDKGFNRVAIENNWHKKYPFASCTWGDTVPYLRNEKYSESFHSILESTKAIQNKGLLGVIQTRKSNKVNHLVNWHTYNMLASSAAIVQAAMPDYSSNVNPEIEKPNSGKLMVQNAIDSKSIYHTFDNRPLSPLNISHDWSALAWSRIARYVKNYHLAYAYNSFPIAADDINVSLANSIYRPNSEKMETNLNSQRVCLDVVNSIDLVQLLDDMSWKEVLRLRKEILPKSKKLRSYLISEVVKRTKASNASPILYQEEMEKLKLDFEQRKDDYANEWEKLRIISVTRSGGVVGGGVLANGASLLAIPKSLDEFIILLLGTGLVAGAALSKDLAAYLPKKRNFIKHPLQFTEVLKDRSGNK